VVFLGEVGVERKKKNNNLILNHNYLQGLREVNDNKERNMEVKYFVAIMFHLLIILVFVKGRYGRDFKDLKWNNQHLT
jgi:hypothetical protein